MIYILRGKLQLSKKKKKCTHAGSSHPNNAAEKQGFPYFYCISTATHRVTGEKKVPD